MLRKNSIAIRIGVDPKAFKDEKEWVEKKVPTRDVGTILNLDQVRHIGETPRFHNLEALFF